MSDTMIHRFEWHKAVMQAEGLTPTAKNVAAVLAVQFYNEQTGQLNPSQKTLADYLKVHRETIKTALRDLREAGWLMATGDGGRGKAPQMRLLIPGKIVPFRARKGGAKDPVQAEKRGGDLQRKGGQITPPLYKDKQSLEQRARASTAFARERFEGNATDGLRLVEKSDHQALNSWSDWLRKRGLPELHQLPIVEQSEKGNTFFALPWRKPPTNPRHEEQAMRLSLIHI